MRDDTDAADNLCCPQGSLKGEQQKGLGVALPLVPYVDRKLTEKQNRHGVGVISLLRSRKERPLDLRGTQSYVADDLPRGIIGNNIRARRTAHLICPRVALEPSVE